MIRETLQLGDPLLKEKCVDVEQTDPKIDSIIEDLFDTLESEQLAGIAAPQIGYPINLFVSNIIRYRNGKKEIEDEERVYINPRILFESTEENVIFEGCGSVANRCLFGPVKRAKRVIIEAYDRSFRKFTLECDGILARVILHEYDHLKNIEFLNKVSDFSLLMSNENFKKYAKNHPEIWKAGEISVKNLNYLIN